MSETLETVKLNFDGRLASLGQLHLYEYSRSQYAFARFVTTVEQYRRTAVVIDRVSSSRSIDMIVSAPIRGSFDLSVLVPVANEAASQLAGISFKAIFSYVWAKLLPPSEERTKIAVDLASIELLRERERAKISISRDENETERLKIFQSILERSSATTEQFIDLLKRSIDNPDPRIFRRGYDLPTLARAEEMAKADLKREQTILNNEQSLERADPGGLNRLSNKLRPMVNDIALPLRRSADRCYLGDSANDNAYVRLDADRVAEVTSKYIDDEPLIFKGLLRSYDRFTYRGKIESSYFEKTMHFTVDLDNRAALRPKIVEAMGKQDLIMICISYRDVSGMITSLILKDIEI